MQPAQHQPWGRRQQQQRARCLTPQAGAKLAADDTRRRPADGMQRDDGADVQRARLAALLERLAGAAAVAGLLARWR